MNFELVRKALPLLLCAAGITFSPEAEGVPAWPGTFVVVQPDGSSLSIVKKGDERGHLWLTSDGFAVREKDNGYYYILPSGEMSSMLASDPSDRTPGEASLLDSFDKESVFSHELRAARDANPRFSRAPRAASDFDPELPANPVPGLFDASFPSKGKQKSLVFLVQYPDVEFSVEDAYDYFHRMLNEPDFSDNGCSMSARDYFIESSCGAFDPEFVVYGPLTLKNNRRYYGMNMANSGMDRAAEEMVIEACEAYNDKIDFREYDTNGDGLIDNIFVFYAGVGENASTVSSSVWPHSYDVRERYPDKIYDGVQLATYGCSNELVPRNDYHGKLMPDAIGTFCHEFGHVMGLPDLYSTSYKEGAFHPGKWSIMSSGSYNDNGCTPPTYSSFERAALGWLTPEYITSGHHTLGHLLHTNRAFIIPTDRKTEYFLLETRMQEGNDEYLPGEGLLVWHIDYDPHVWEFNICNNNPDHQYIDIVEAAGDISNPMFAGFPALDFTQDFTFNTTPSLRSWSGRNLGVGLRNISFTDDNEMEFDADVDYVLTSVSEVSSEETGIHVSDGRISYSGEAGDEAEVYTSAGVFTARIAAGTISSRLEKGIYIVRAGDRTAKILVN